MKLSSSLASQIKPKHRGEGPESIADSCPQLFPPKNTTGHHLPKTQDSSTQETAPYPH